MMSHPAQPPASQPGVDVLAAFRGVDQHRARELAAAAGVSKTTRLHEPRPERVPRPAQVARRLAAR